MTVIQTTPLPKEIIVAHGEVAPRRDIAQFVGNLSTEVDIAPVVSAVTSPNRVLERLKPLSSLTAEQQIGGIIIDSFDGDCWRVLERIDELLEVPSILCTTSPNYIRRAEQKGYIAFLYKLGAACDMRSLLIAEFPIFVPLRAAAK